MCVGFEMLVDGCAASFESGWMCDRFQGRFTAVAVTRVPDPSLCGGTPFSVLSESRSAPRSGRLGGFGSWIASRGRVGGWRR